MKKSRKNKKLMTNAFIFKYLLSDIRDMRKLTKKWGPDEISFTYNIPTDKVNYGIYCELHDECERLYGKNIDFITSKKRYKWPPDVNLMRDRFFKQAKIVRNYYSKLYVDSEEDLLNYDISVEDNSEDDDSYYFDRRTKLLPYMRKKEFIKMDCVHDSLDSKQFHINAKKAFTHSSFYYFHNVLKYNWNALMYHFKRIYKEEI